MYYITFQMSPWQPGWMNMMIHRKILEKEEILSRNVSKRPIGEGKQTRQTFHNRKSSLRGTVTLAFNIQPSTDRQNEKMCKWKICRCTIVQTNSLWTQCYLETADGTSYVAAKQRYSVQSCKCNLCAKLEYQIKHLRIKYCFHPAKQREQNCHFLINWCQILLRKMLFAAVATVGFFHIY